MILLGKIEIMTYLYDILLEMGLVSSKREYKRLLREGAIKYLYNGKWIKVRG